MSKGLAFVFILLSILFQVLSLIFSKFASLRLAATTPGAVTAYFPWYLASLACLGLQAICWPLALRRFPLFWSYLFMSALYIAIPLVSYYVFNESISAWNIAGALIIMVGTMVMLTGGKEAGRV